MVFSSNVFLFFFLPLLLLFYYLSPKKARNAVLLLFSLIFYGWGEPKYLLLMIAVILLNYGAGIIIHSINGKKKQRLILILAIVLNLGILAYFKYSAFIVSSVKALFRLSAVKIPTVILPIGISFYIFQSMSYTIDVYRETCSCQRNLISFAAYVSMFPQLIAGPIVKYRDIDEKLQNRTENISQFTDGVYIFVIGLGKKVLLANQAGELWNSVSAGFGTLSAWVGLAAYSAHIYFDFSGYSDMALGLGKMLGFDFFPNFDYPFVSLSISEFWRRWHISLASWFREYVYIPLGGNQHGRIRLLFNLLIVWGLTGLWHGASWNFVLWGLYYGVLIVLERFVYGEKLKKLPVFFQRIYTILFVFLGWTLFCWERFSEFKVYCMRLFSAVPSGEKELKLMLAYIPLMLIASVAATPLTSGIEKKYGSRKLFLMGRNAFIVIVLVLSVASLVTQSYNPFIYFRF